MRVLTLALIFVAFSHQLPPGPEQFTAASVAEGRRLIVAYGCLGCHAIPGFTGIAFHGPALGNAGRKFRPEWLRAWLRNPSAVDPAARMGNFSLTDRQVSRLEAFLLSQRIATPPAGPGGQAMADADAGRALFDTLACRSCHTPSATGFSGLEGLGGKVRPEWLFEFLKDPPRVQPGTPMRGYGLTDRQVGDLAAFLLRDNGPRVTSDDAMPSNLSAVKEGRAEFEQLSCTSCHRVDGMPAPLLSGLPVASGEVAWKLVVPKSFAGSDMPAFHLSWKDATSIELAIRNPQ